MIVNTWLIDPEEASKVLNDPWVYDRVTDDTCPETIEWPDNAWYVGGHVNDELVAVFVVHQAERGYQFHCNILKDYRQFKDELSAQALDLLFPIFGKLYCEIPSLYPQIIEFAQRFGFRTVEVRENDYLKNGSRYDVHVLELTSWV